MGMASVLRLFSVHCPFCIITTPTYHLVWKEGLVTVAFIPAMSQFRCGACTESAHSEWKYDSAHNTLLQTHDVAISEQIVRQNVLRDQSNRQIGRSPYTMLLNSHPRSGSAAVGAMVGSYLFFSF